MSRNLTSKLVVGGPAQGAVNVMHSAGTTVTANTSHFNTPRPSLSPTQVPTSAPTKEPTEICFEPKIVYSFVSCSAVLLLLCLFLLYLLWKQRKTKKDEGTMTSTKTDDTDTVKMVTGWKEDVAVTPRDEEPYIPYIPASPSKPQTTKPKVVHERMACHRPELTKNTSMKSGFGRMQHNQEEYATKAKTPKARQVALGHLRERTNSLDEVPLRERSSSLHDVTLGTSLDRSRSGEDSEV